jgi:hypothetical protein
MCLRRKYNTDPGLHDRDWYMRPVFINHHDFDYMIFDTACGNPTYGPAIEWTKSSFTTEDDGKVENLKNNRTKVWGNIAEAWLNFWGTATVQLAPIKFYARPTDKDYEWMNLYDALKYNVAAKFNYKDKTIYFYIMWHDVNKEARLNKESFKVGDSIQISYHRGNMSANGSNFYFGDLKKYLNNTKFMGLTHDETKEYTFKKECTGAKLFSIMEGLCTKGWEFSYEKVDGKHKIDVISTTPKIMEGGQRGADTGNLLFSGTFFDFCKILGVQVINGAFSVIL